MRLANILLQNNCLHHLGKPLMFIKSPYMYLKVVNRKLEQNIIPQRTGVKGQINDIFLSDNY
jgi:hypothetical protein